MSHLTEGDHLDGCGLVHPLAVAENDELSLSIPKKL